MVCTYKIKTNNYMISFGLYKNRIEVQKTGQTQKKDDKDDSRQTSNFFTDFLKMKWNSENNRLYRLKQIITNGYRTCQIAAGFSHIFPSSGGESTMPPSIMGSGAALH